jgi:hypothetical protein
MNDSSHLVDATLKNLRDILNSSTNPVMDPTSKWNTAQKSKIIEPSLTPKQMDSVTAVLAVQKLSDQKSVLDKTQTLVQQLQKQLLEGTFGHWF